MPKRLTGIAKKWAEQIKLGKRGTKKNTIKNSYYKKEAAYKETKLEIPAQFIAQPSKFVQEIKSISKNKKYKLIIPMRLKYEQGFTLEKIRKTDKKWFNENKKAITKELAKSLADIHLKYGIIHSDLNDANIVIRKTKTGKPKVKLIDFEFSTSIKKIPKFYESNERMMEFEFSRIKDTIKEMGKTDKENKELWKLFQKEYEKAAEKY